ncbi:hypothetical protein [Tautonia rosea]|uniref:hypothetical protein n=1 Tax=Tautonia rosea TaxID=2728037 RepID=UPI001473AC1A|nr:hypothetical protein [Tautonia rosea]
MSYAPEPSDRALLWRLAVIGGESPLNGLDKPKVDPKVRKRLKAAGFTEEETRKPPTGGRGILHISISEKGWNYLAEHTTAPLSSRANVVPVLQGFLAQLDRFLTAHNLSLADFFRLKPQSNPPSEPTADPQRNGTPPPTIALTQRILDAYNRLSGGRLNVRVRLADLREALADIPRSALDNTLLQLATSGQAALYRLDNPLEIHERDREAVLLTPAGDPRHVIYLGGQGS